MATIGKIEEFKKADGTGFRYFFEKDLKQNENVYIKMPTVTSNKRGVNDIGWQSESTVNIKATLCHFLKEGEEDTALWTDIDNNVDINKTVTYLKIVAGSTGGKVYINAILC